MLSHLFRISHHKKEPIIKGAHVPLLTHANSYCYVYMSSANLLEIVESLSSREACIFLDEITYFMLLPNGINLNTILINNIMYVNIYLRNIHAIHAILATQRTFISLFCPSKRYHLPFDLTIYRDG